MAFMEVYSFGRETMENRQYYIVSGSVFLCSQHHFFACAQIWHSCKCTPLEEKSWKIVNIVLPKMKCTPQELIVLLITGDTYLLHYLIEK